MPSVVGGRARSHPPMDCPGGQSWSGRPGCRRPAGYFGLIGLAGGVQLGPGPVGERLDDHRLKQVAGGAQLRVEAAKLAGGQPRLGRRGGCEECRWTGSPCNLEIPLSSV